MWNSQTKIQSFLNQQCRFYIHLNNVHACTNNWIFYSGLLLTMSHTYWCCFSILSRALFVICCCFVYIRTFPSVCIFFLHIFSLLVANGWLICLDDKQFPKDGSKKSLSEILQGIELMLKYYILYAILESVAGPLVPIWPSKISLL